MCSLKRITEKSEKSALKKPTSPIPIKARMTSKKGSPILAAIGVRIVAIDHQTTPKPKTSLPPILSAQIPPTICNQMNISTVHA